MKYRKYSRGNTKFKPERRTISKHSNITKGRREERRKKIRQLREEGLSYADIAVSLGVSKSTIRREIAKKTSYKKDKIHDFPIGLYRRKPPTTEEQLRSLKKRLKLIKEIEENYFKLRKPRANSCNKLTLTIDLDAIARGHKPLRCNPKPPITMNSPFRIELEIIILGKKSLVGEITLEPQR